MKLLRNPVAVAVLAVAALALVGNSVYRQISRQPRRGPRVSAPAAAVAPAPAKPAMPLAQAAPEKAAPASAPATAITLEKQTMPPAGAPAAGLDLDLIQADAARWAQGRRDPFQIRSMAARPVFPPAREVLTLSAVWRQTDSSLAVLNNRIYAAGDTVLRYTIKSIEPDRVWVQGPNGREMVEFKSAETIRTNTQPKTALGAKVGAPDNP